MRVWRARAATLVVVLGTALVFALAAPSFTFTTKITDFLPDDSQDRGAQIAAMLAESELSKVMMIDLSGADPGALHTLATKLIEHLRTQPDVASARSGRC